MINIKSFVMKLLSISIVLLISLSMIDINILSSEEEEPTLDPGAYTFTVPASVPFDAEDGTGSFSISCLYGDGFESIDISITSLNGYRLITEQGQELTYKLLDASSSEITDNPFKINHADFGGELGTFTDNFSLISTKPDYAGNYTDTITFEIEPKYFEYNITYNLGDGAWKDGYTPINKYTINDTITLPTSSNITKENSVFMGWYLSDIFEGDPITSFNGLDYVGGITVYARWVTDAKLPIVEEQPIVEEVKEDIEEIKEEEIPKEEEEIQEEPLPEQEEVIEEEIPEVIEEISEEAND